MITMITLLNIKLYFITDERLKRKDRALTSHRIEGNITLF
jgi:hypothetical protein